ncbi:hypothetical protein MMC26_003453 [Xylographa opegraphella]|nr:hypothetical protein [Xylographa opegraphella]
MKKFNYCLGLSSIEIGNKTSVSPSIDRVVQKAFEELKEACGPNGKLNRTSETIRKCFEQTNNVIVASRDYIALIVSANPYAALAWTGVSVLLPLLLSPTEEDAAAIKGVDYITNLMMVYEWKQNIYLHDGEAVSDFKVQTVRLYTMILEYAATLLVHKHQNPSKRWVRDVFQAGDWSSRIESIQERDTSCRDVTDAIAALRAKQWQDEERRWYEKLLQQPRQDEERRHIRSLYSNYNADKNVVPERISVLAKYLVNRRGEVLTVDTKAPTMCYFFFKDGDINRVDAAKALCAFLHQLIMQQSDLYQYAKKDFENKSEIFLTDFDALWSIFLKATANASGREIICVLDALDECNESSRKMLIAKLVQLYSIADSIDSRKPVLKFLVTSRPDFNIVRDFKYLTSTITEVRLRGENESVHISREIDLVIDFKVKELGSKMDLSESQQSSLQEELLSVPHRTYLWLYLTFDTIEKKLELSKDEIAVIAKTIPKNVDEAYPTILDRSPDRDRARRLLHIVLAATRPLTLQEANVAIVMRESQESYTDLDLWRPDIAEDRIKNMCGLFLSVVDSKVYLIHQMAREFLVCDDHASCSLVEQNLSSTHWKMSFHPERSNLSMARICIRYLQLEDFEKTELAIFEEKSEVAESEVSENEVSENEVSENELSENEVSKNDVVTINEEENEVEESEVEESEMSEGKVEGKALEKIRQYERDYIFLSYAAQYWAAHFTQANTLPDYELIKTVADRVCNTSSRSFRIWFYMYSWITGNYKIISTLHVTNILVGALFGHVAVVQLLLKHKNVRINSKDNDGLTPLLYAAIEGHEAIVELLLKQKNVQVDSKDNFGQTPLLYAARSGHETVVALLLKRANVKADSKDHDGRTPLSYAAESGQVAVIALLLKRANVKADSKDHDGRTPLSYAAGSSQVAVVALLLKRADVKADSKDHDRHTPLFYAKKKKAVVKLLEEHLAQSEHSHSIETSEVL